MTLPPEFVAAIEDAVWRALDEGATPREIEAEVKNAIVTWDEDK